MWFKKGIGNANRPNIYRLVERLIDNFAGQLDQACHKMLVGLDHKVIAGTEMAPVSKCTMQQR